jgi:hypothetical protein
VAKKKVLDKKCQMPNMPPAADERKQPRFLARKTGSLKKEGWLRKRFLTKSVKCLICHSAANERKQHLSSTG